jgi:hypothetical protein
MATQVTSEIHLDGIHCSLTLRRYPGGVLMLRISGTDIGEFGTRPMLALKDLLTDNEPVHLFIDAREVRGASISVSGEWAQWLRAQKADLQNISMLTGSRYVEITANFVRRFAELEFDAAVLESLS